MRTSTCLAWALLPLLAGDAFAGTVRLEPLPTNAPYTIPLAVSDGGRFVAAYAQFPSSPVHGVLWGPDRTTPVPGWPSPPFVIPQAISPDGSVVVGRVGNSGAWRWSAADGLIVLASGGDANWTNGQSTLGCIREASGALSGARWERGQPGVIRYAPAAGDGSARIMGASDDLSILVGGTFGDGQRAARWSAAGAPATVLEALPFSSYGFAEAISGDGTTVVGSTGFSASIRYPVTWSASGQATFLPTPAQFGYGTAIAVSRDGRVIIGHCWQTVGGDRSVVWVNGEAHLLSDLLVPAGVAPTLAQTLVVMAVSRDGQFITAFRSWTEGVPYLIQLPPACGTADFNGDGDAGTDADIEAFFACLAGDCCPTCFHAGADFDADGQTGTDADIDSFFRVLAGGTC